MERLRRPDGSPPAEKSKATEAHVSAQSLGLIILANNSATRASASGSGSGAGSLHALPLGVIWTIGGTLISAACAGFAGRLRGGLA